MANEAKKPTTEERLIYLEDGIRSIDRWMESQDEQLIDLRDERKDDRDVLKSIDEKTDEAKKEIVIFTFELIAIIVGFLSLLLAIIVLTVNQGEINSELVCVYATLGLFFIILFGIFVYYWRKKNFPKVKGTDYEKIISYIGSKIESNNSDLVDLIDSKNSDMSDYIKEEISKCCKYTDDKINEVAEFIKKNKSK